MSVSGRPSRYSLVSKEKLFTRRRYQQRERLSDWNASSTLCSLLLSQPSAPSSPLLGLHLGCYRKHSIISDADWLRTKSPVLTTNSNSSSLTQNMRSISSPITRSRLDAILNTDSTEHLGGGMCEGEGSRVALVGVDVPVSSSTRLSLVRESYAAEVVECNVYETSSTRMAIQRAIRGCSTTRCGESMFDVLISDLTAPLDLDLQSSRFQTNPSLDLALMSSSQNDLVVAVDDDVRGLRSRSAAMSPVMASLSIGIPLLKPSGVALIRLNHNPSGQERNDEARCENNETAFSAIRQLRSRFSTVDVHYDPFGFVAVCHGNNSGCSRAHGFREDFPGLLPSGVQRPRQWSMAEVRRSRRQTSFFMAVHPSYAGAPQPQAVQHHLTRKKKWEETMGRTQESYNGMVSSLVDSFEDGK